MLRFTAFLGGLLLCASVQAEDPWCTDGDYWFGEELAGSGFSLTFIPCYHPELGPIGVDFSPTQCLFNKAAPAPSLRFIGKFPLNGEYVEVDAIGAQYLSPYDVIRFDADQLVVPKAGISFDAEFPEVAADSFLEIEFFDEATFELFFEPLGGSFVVGTPVYGVLSYHIEELGIDRSLPFIQVLRSPDARCTK